MPTHFVPNISDPSLLAQLRRLDVILAVGADDRFRESTEALGRILLEKGVATRTDIWNGEAHCARDWRDMVQCYF